MLKKRIIPCLDIKDGRTVKGSSFIDLRDAGDPIQLAQRYAEAGADELVFLDITATIERRKTLVALVEQIAKVVDIPFAVGGGISNTADVRSLLDAGADKVCINSAALSDPSLITDISSRYGKQCLVVAIDAQLDDDQWIVYSHGGRKSTGKLATKWAKQAKELGAGELLITSIDADGQQDGFQVDLLRAVSTMLSIPIIASGGAGTMNDFAEVFQETSVTGALAASVFHFQKISIPRLKAYLQTQQIEVRCL